MALSAAATVATSTSSSAISCCCSSIRNTASSGRLQGSSNWASVRSNGSFSLAQKLMLGMSSGGNSGPVQHLQIPRTQQQKIMATLGEKTEEPEVEKKTEEYSENMQNAMGTNLTYRHELGMNYNHVLPDLIVGSCLQTPADVDRLKVAGVGTIFCLQQDPDLAYFSVDIGAIQDRAGEVEGIEHIRAPIRDFDPYDLRLRLPKVVATLYKAAKKNEKISYVHCTAGLGRAPAVALTYMYWIRGYDLFEANAMLQSVRYCHPKLDSIKAATADLLTGNASKKVLLSWMRGASESVEIAGLDVGWYERIVFDRGDDGHFYAQRDVPIGRYEFKYIVDGNWMNNPDMPVTHPNKDGHVNNYIEVTGDAADAELWEFRRRIMADDFVLTEEHRKIIKEKLESLADE
ncbi:unnamed protein product [Calypogeia fissa]